MTTRFSIALFQTHFPEIDFQPGGVAEYPGKLLEPGGGYIRQSFIQPLDFRVHGLLELVAFIHGDPGIIRVFVSPNGFCPVIQPIGDFPVAHHAG